MTNDNNSCPKCLSPYGYLDGALWICPECGHEWSQNDISNDQVLLNLPQFLDVNGIELKNGDTVRTVKYLKVGSHTIKSGTKVKGIRLLEESVNDHDISCKVDGLGSVYLKCSVVKKDS